ncbi:hypothetical protein VTL71DRAFT_7521 [Oculimacula yallundae]|uniref:Uncharacterized protein n=1 Tax=Oculimacula yallundae TaxID=86028 RepID=A0ABR4BUF7_9HELO
MSASSSTASSTLTRSRLAVFGFASVATAVTAYWFYRSLIEEEDKAQVSGLRRSNAVHRRRRRTTTNDISPDLRHGGDVFFDDAVGNDGQGQVVPRTLTDGETVVDDQAFAEDYGWTNMPQSYQRNGQNIVQLLFRVSEDATRRNAYVHRGCACNSCNMLPIRGIRYRCANCADYDLCEGCESQGLHIKTHIFYKIKVPAISFGPRHIQPVWYTGDPENVMRALPKEITTKLSRETGFERPELEAYWEQWTFMANTDWRDDPDDINLAMDRRTFERCLVPLGGSNNSAPSLIYDRMFAFYDTNKDDLISFPEFLHGVAYRKKKDKWRKIFEGYDIDGDGFVDRKDCLRMFRSYYVLHRQIHKDMIEGAEEQQMSSTEAHRLISGRQPLSSAFGQDGRYPRAPDPRTGEGKSAQVNGDLQIVDGKGIMNESGNDTGNREDIFKREDPRMNRSNWDGELDRYSSAYWDTMVNPPHTVDEMPAVLQNLQRVRGQIVEALSDAPVESATIEREDDEVSNSDSALSNPVADRNWPPSYPKILDEDAEAIDGPGTTVENVRKESRRAVIQQAVYREQTQDDIHNRWQRRRFYTDEEEGAAPPAHWKEEDDILAQSGKAGESSKAHSRPTIHSRSSSRVRFAEDMDDFDTQSNVSTSSRSVPERWGGMEIPDAERDAGKEILYQVTQQAFNELLDPLFKDKEDQAIEAASTKAEREQWGSLYNNPEFIQWALEKEAEETKPKKVKITRYPADGPPPPPPPPGTSSLWPTFTEVEVEQVREIPLEELLAATGFEVDESLARQNEDNDDDKGDGEEISDFESIPETTPPRAQVDEPSSSEMPVAIVPRSSARPEEHEPMMRISSREATADGSGIDDEAIGELPQVTVSAINAVQGDRPRSGTSSTDVVVHDAVVLDEKVSEEPSGSALESVTEEDVYRSRVSSNDDSQGSAESSSKGASEVTVPVLPEPGQLGFNLRNSSTDAVDNPSEVVVNLPGSRDVQERAVQFDLPEYSTPDTTDRDPTLPQFRPDTIDTPRLTTESLLLLQQDPEVRSQIAYGKDKELPDVTPLSNGTDPSKPAITYKRPRRERLYELWKIDRAEKEAERKGGWGRLSFEEFDSRVKSATGEGRGSQMDYLGSWIDFCIP